MTKTSIHELTFSLTNGLTLLQCWYHNTNLPARLTQGLENLPRNLRHEAFHRRRWRHWQTAQKTATNDKLIPQPKTSVTSSNIKLTEMTVSVLWSRSINGNGIWLLKETAPYIPIASLVGHPVQPGETPTNKLWNTWKYYFLIIQVLKTPEIKNERNWNQKLDVYRSGGSTISVVQKHWIQMLNC